MKTTLRILKNNKKELFEYGQMLGLKTNDWASLAPNLVISDQGILTNQDSSLTTVIPSSIMQVGVSADKISLMFQGLLQPDTSLVSNRVIFVDNFNAITNQFSMSGSTPSISKGVSYPSSLQRNKSSRVMTTDNVWLIDLFSLGVAYQQITETDNRYYVVDTTIYEGWNRFSSNEITSIFKDLPKNTGKAVVKRYLALLNQSKYQFVKQNCRTRSAYLNAICEVTKLKPLIQMEVCIQDKKYQSYLTEILSTTSPLQAFCFEGDTNARDFSPFVYAEEMYLRDKYGVDICTGPIREDLPLNLSVLKLCQNANSTPTPILWYTRPETLPELLFTSSYQEVVTIIETNLVARQFVAENLAKLGLIKLVDMKGSNTKLLSQVLFKFMQSVEKLAQLNLSQRKI